MTKLLDIETEFAKYFVIKDPYILRMIFATLIGNQCINRDPIWLMVIGASSGGKTSLVAPCGLVPNVHFLDDMTDRTLLSGFKIKGKEASFLKKVGSGVLIFSDFTSILAKRSEIRGEILTQLKLVFDGNLKKETGVGTISWTGKIGAICCSTPDVYTYMENSRSAGERFAYYWLDQPTNQEILDKQATHDLSAREITFKMQELYADYFKGVNDFGEQHHIKLKMSKDQKDAIQNAAIFCVRAKSTIRTDFKTGQPNAIPNISGVGRDAKIFDTILHALQIMDAYEHDDPTRTVSDEMVKIIKKCAYSSINRERRKILEILANHGSTLTTSQIGAVQGLGLEKDMVMQYLAPLHAVGMISKNTGRGAHAWYIDDPQVLDFVTRVSRTVVDTSPVGALEIPAEEENIFDEYNRLAEEERGEAEVV